MEQKGEVKRKREESGCDWHTLQSGGAERLSRHCCRSEQCKLQLILETWARTHSMEVRRSVFQRNKVISHPLTSQGIPPFARGVGLQGTSSANLRTSTTELYFSLSKGGKGVEGTPQRTEVTNTGGNEGTIKKMAGSPSPPSTYTSQLHWWQPKTVDQHWDFTVEK